MYVCMCMCVCVYVGTCGGKNVKKCEEVYGIVCIKNQQTTKNFLYGNNVVRPHLFQGMIAQT